MYELQPVSRFNGIVHFVSRSVAWASRGSAVFRSDDRGANWRFVGRIPCRWDRRLLSYTKVTGRLFRAGIRHIVCTEDGAVVVVGARQIFRLEPSDGKLLALAPVVGSHPLTVCVDGNDLYYGEYRGNPERSPVHVWKSTDGGSSWQQAWRFDSVRHVHGVFKDSFSNSMWITTGDGDHEAAIWQTTDGFRTVEKRLGGSQQLRAVQLLFTKDYIYFGSDTPLERNLLYRYSRSDGRLEALQEVEGSVFYGCRLGDGLFFSTACEPSRVNKSRSAAIWWSRDGATWDRLASFRKDRLPARYFQYGQVIFPAGPGDGKSLWCTPIATESDHQAVQYRFEHDPQHERPCL